jgi:hypothetical protein
MEDHGLFAEGQFRRASREEAALPKSPGKLWDDARNPPNLYLIAALPQLPPASTTKE